MILCHADSKPSVWHSDQWRDRLLYGAGARPLQHFGDNDAAGLRIQYDAEKSLCVEQSADAQFFSIEWDSNRVRMFFCRSATHLAITLLVQIQRCGVDTKQLEAKRSVLQFPCLNPGQR